MNSIKGLVILIITLGCITSCYYDNEEALYPNLNNICDTSAVTFSGSIVPILNNNCLGCHSSSAYTTSGGSIRIDGYADVSARSARILGDIKQDPGYDPMPKSGGKLTDCQILLFEIWIRNGKLNN